ncbi:PREDICTED: putative F-box protein At5g15660 [Camelina sativa]|uniref:F-box protein At5g15660 n=1 Tax=Camelina sativa TaxID=90675 RepID=A0ABM1QTG4_CAMSA|nr:PREDICTED: putative F-box protein At5g15660 [Camelina sativa]
MRFLSRNWFKLDSQSKAKDRQKKSRVSKTEAIDHEKKIQQKDQNRAQKHRTNASEERANFDELPHDLVIEIFGRLPSKSLARFLTVSKLWATTIRSPDFIRSYPRGSSWQPRTLIAADLDSHGSGGATGNLCFFKWPSSSSPKSFISRLTCPVNYDQHMECNYHHVNGLISVGYGQEQIVFNPITGRSITLPRARTMRKLVKSFFGYDPVSDEFKVVCMTEKMYDRHHEEPSSEHQVLTFTLGAESSADVKKSWHMINCSIPRRPCTNGVCINGVVYYVARTGAQMSHMRLTRFALRPGDSLDLLTSLPEEIKTSSISNLFLINYEGKVAISTHTSFYTYNVWVMNQEGGKHEWFKKITFSIEPSNWKRLLDNLYVRGATHTGEIILAPTHYSEAFYIFHYNPKKKSCRKIHIQVSARYKVKLHRRKAYVFSDYVDSVRLL